MVYSLSHTGDSQYYELNVGDRLLISNPYTGDSWTVTFTPAGDDEKQIVMEGGYLAMIEDWELFSGRIQLRRKAIEIDPVEITDSGTFEYRDPHGNLAQVVKVEVIFGEQQHILFIQKEKCTNTQLPMSRTNPLHSSSAITEPVPTYVYASIAGGIILAVILCCCCVRKCCCKKGSSKRDESAPAAVYYHVSSSSNERSDALLMMCVFLLLLQNPCSNCRIRINLQAKVTLLPLLQMTLINQ